MFEILKKSNGVLIGLFFKILLWFVVLKKKKLFMENFKEINIF